jgi:hypothetical protein
MMMIGVGRQRRHTSNHGCSFLLGLEVETGGIVCVVTPRGQSKKKRPSCLSLKTDIGEHQDP